MRWNAADFDREKPTTPNNSQQAIGGSVKKTIRSKREIIKKKMKFKNACRKTEKQILDSSHLQTALTVGT